MLRFNRFHDGLIRQINISVNYPKATREAIITVSARDTTISAENNWVNVVFYLKGIAEYRINEDIKINFQVLSDGISIDHIENKFYIDFSPWTDGIMKIDNIRRSPIYFSSSELKWDIFEYSNFAE